MVGCNPVKHGFTHPQNWGFYRGPVLVSNIVIYIYAMVQYLHPRIWLLVIALMLSVLFCSVLAFGQTNAEEATLRQQLAAAPTDTSKVLLLIELGQAIEGNQPEAAKNCYRQARALAQQLGYAMGQMKFYTNYSAALNAQGLYDSGLLINEEGLAFAKKINSSLYVAATTGNIGVSYMLKEDYEKALEYNLAALALLEKMGDNLKLCVMHSNVGAILGEMGQYENSLHHHLTAMALARQLNDSNQIAATLSNAGINYTRLKLYDSATLLLTEANAISRSTSNNYLLMNTLLNLNNILMATSQYAKMPALCQQALDISQKIGDKTGESIAYHGLAIAAFFNKNYADAGRYANASLAAAQSVGYKDEQSEIYELLSALALLDGNLIGYDKYKRLSANISDSIVNATMLKNTQALQAKYKSVQRQRQIDTLEKEKSKKQQWNYILGLTVAVLVITTVLGYGYYNQRKRLQLQQIETLENEKQLLASQAMLKGQEDERSRVAKDLHDGIGGMLSGIKLSLGAMKGNLILTEQSARLFEGALYKLDETIAEMRRVAHSMMPEALLQLGLTAAVADYCAGVDAAGQLKLNYQHYGLEERLPAETEIVVYRMVQELITNVLKHAHATQAIVQLTRHQQLLQLTVEDNGVGMPPHLQQANGSGLRSLQARATYVKASIDVKSAPGQGTSVHLEIPIA
ncbi:MAG: hypothetical protein EAY75_15790 [Bacteroidetes bacterium]|nr:MAG: hypothetical protein EAY75_15790 [Bacteroidota bacterium]